MSIFLAHHAESNDNSITEIGPVVLSVDLKCRLAGMFIEYTLINWVFHDIEGAGLSTLHSIVALILHSIVAPKVCIIVAMHALLYFY